MPSPRAYLERELSFAIRESDLPSVLAELWPLDGLLDVDGKGYLIDAVTLSRTVHLFGANTEGRTKDRLKLRLNHRRGVVEGCREQKRGLGHDKAVSGLTGWRKPDEVIRLIAELGEIQACFWKERTKLTLVHGGEPAIEVGIDRFVPFDPLDVRRHGKAVLHVEFEGPGVSERHGLLGSRWFRDRLAARLRLLDDRDTKWVRAASYCRNGRRLAITRASALTKFFHDVASVVGAPKAPLAPGGVGEPSWFEDGN